MSQLPVACRHRVHGFSTTGEPAKPRHEQEESAWGNVKHI